MSATQVYPPIEEFSDVDVLALTQFQMDTADDARLSELLYRQQATLLTNDEQQQLAALMHLYQVGLLRNAQAMRVAVERGLMEPLNSQPDRAFR